MRRSLYLFTLMLFASSIFAQAPSEGPLRPAELVKFHKTMGHQFTPVDNLLQVQSASLRNHPEISAEVNKAMLLDFDQQFAQRMAIDAPDFITLQLPFEQGVEVEVELVKVNILSPNFSVTTSDPVEVEWEMGTYYRGVIKDMEGSIAAVSIFDGEVRGMFSGPRIGNYVLGVLKNNNPNRTHILYNDADLTTFNPFECATEDDGRGYTSEQLNGVPNTRALTDCINIYYEVDYDIYQDKGSGTTAWITGNFNEIATLYANENLNYALSQVNIITSSANAYADQSSAGMRSQFQSRYNGFNGDMAHMVSYKSSGGIAAGFAGLCNSNPDNSMCFSSINSTYSTVPTYSWNIMVQTHEMGHLNGSRHTHACVWNGNNTAIDGCYNTEGSCARPGNPSGGGTVMSYCHLQSVGINLANGFGPQPGNVIRSATTNASCLSPCGGGGGNPCDNPIATFPYNEGFENTLGDWSQGTGDDLDWTVNSGGTPSSGTGPSAASQGTYYVYVEASSPNYPSKTTYLNSPCFNLSGQSSVFANFQYHMIGSAVGTLSLQASDDDGATWTTVWSQTGAQGTDWNSASVDLSSYGGGNMLLRYNGTTGTSWQGDLCIDDFELSSSGGGGGGNCTASVSSYPYSEGFESGTGAWSQAGGDDLDWTRDSGGTPSTGTGPSSGAGNSTWYMYVEASGNGTGYPNKTAIFNGPCFDLSGESTATFTYSYHMYSSGGGTEVGSLDLQASTNNGSSWTSLNSISGDQGNSWNNASVNMNAYVGGNVSIRFVAQTAATWRGDIAVDNVGMNDSPGGGGGCTNVDISFTFDNYPEETSWTITDAGGATVASGGTYGSQPDGSSLTVTECLDAGCYNFNIFDSYGDGICCGYGNGSYSVSAGGSVLASGGSFGSSETTNFCVGGASMPALGLPAASASAQPLTFFKGFNIFPNPARSILNVGFESAIQGQATITVTDLAGKVMLSQTSDVNAGHNQVTLQVRDLAQGTYFMVFNNGDVKVNKRFVIMK